MAYTNLKQEIDNYVYENHENEILGKNLQKVLKDMVDVLGDGYRFMGVARTNTTIPIPEEQVFYLVGNGEYGNFGSTKTVPLGFIGVMYYDTQWNMSLINLNLNALNLNYYEGGSAIFSNRGLARQSVPNDLRHKGLIISYVANGIQYCELCINSASATWGDDASWYQIYPFNSVSVSQNTETKKNIITIQVGNVQAEILNAAENVNLVKETNCAIDENGEKASTSAVYSVYCLDVSKASYIRFNPKMGGSGYMVFTLADQTKDIQRYKNSEGKFLTIPVPQNALNLAFSNVEENTDLVVQMIAGNTNYFRNIANFDKGFTPQVSKWKPGYISNSGKIVEYETAVHTIIPTIGCTHLITNIQGYSSSCFWFFKKDGTTVNSGLNNKNIIKTDYKPTHIVEIPENTIAVGISSASIPDATNYIRLIPNVNEKTIGGNVSCVDSFEWEQDKYYSKNYEGKLIANETGESISKTTIDVSRAKFVIGRVQTGSVGIIKWVDKYNNASNGSYYSGSVLKCIPCVENAKNLSFGEIDPSTLTSLFLIGENEYNDKDVKQEVFLNKANSFYYNKGIAEKKNTKPLGIYVGGQSNAAGFTPHADMPSYLEQAFPINNCQADINLSGDSEITPSAFSAYADPWSWGFDTELIYDICVRDLIDLKLVKRAKGSTPISPIYASGTTGVWTADYENLEDGLFSILRQAENMIKFHKDVAFDYKAIIWHQGESDMFDPLNYYRNLKNVIAYFRGVFGNSQIPFITGSISELSSSYYPEFDEAYERICAEDKNVHIIDMSGAPLRDDNHFSAASCIYLGDMVHDKMVDLGIIEATKINPTRPW